MNKILYITAILLLFGVSITQADEGYDPIMYDSEEDADDNLFSIIPPTPIKVGINKSPIENEENKTPPPPPPSSFEETNSNTSSEVVVTSDINEDKVQIPTKDNINIPAPSTQAPISQPTAINTNVGLVDNFNQPVPSNTQTQGTWIDTVVDAVKPIENTSPPSSQDESIEDMMSNSRNSKRRANAAVFNISGIMLRMTLPQVEEILRGKKFTKVAEKFEIPNFIKWRNEEKCRNNGVVGYERLNSCVVTLSKKDGHQYPETVKFARFDTKEEIEVKLTSNFSNNKVYRILYTSLAPTITGNSAKAAYLRNIKIYDFWKKINQKYGTPDNKDEVMWGLGGNKPYLKASSGKLLLEDPMFKELDYTRMSREDQRFMNTDLFNF